MYDNLSIDELKAQLDEKDKKIAALRHTLQNAIPKLELILKFAFTQPTYTKAEVHANISRVLNRFKAGD